MSKLKDLRAKGTDIRLSNGEIVNIKPSKLSTQADGAILMQENKFSKAILLYITEALKRDDPSITDDEIEELNDDDLKVITEAVLKVNKLIAGDDEKKPTQS